MSIIRIHDCAYIALSEAFNALPGIEPFDDIYPVVILEKLPDGIKEVIRKQVNMEINDLLGY